MNDVILIYYQFRYVRYLSDICRYIWYLPISFRYRTYLKFRFVYQSNFASKMFDFADMSRYRYPIAIILIRLATPDRFTSDGRTNMKNLRPPTQKAPSGQKPYIQKIRACGGQWLFLGNSPQIAKIPEFMFFSSGKSLFEPDGRVPCSVLHKLHICTRKN